MPSPASDSTVPDVPPSLNALGYAPPARRSDDQSRMGNLSLACSGIAMVLVLIIVALAFAGGVLLVNVGPLFLAAWLLLIAAVLAGVVFGILGLAQHHSSRRSAIGGLVICVLIIGILLLIRAMLSAI